MIELVEYLDERKRSPFAEWRANLDATTRGRITISLARLSSGNPSGVKSVGAGVSEALLDFGPGCRICFGQQGDRFILLLDGGSKRGQQNDIGSAQSRWQDYKSKRLKKP